ncbi:MAG: MMPL family transporter [Deltaproteobacteria bacterium]
MSGRATTEVDDIGPIARRFEALTSWIAPRCHRHPIVTLLVAAVLVGIGGMSATRLRLDTDLVALLPETFPSVKSLEALRKRFGVVGNAIVVAHGEDPRQLEKYADDLAVELEKLETVDFVNHRRADAFFKERALYFLEVEDIEEIQDRIDETIRWHKKEANPLLVDIADEGKPSLDFSHLEEKRSPLKRSLGGPRSGSQTHYVSDDGKLLLIFIRPKKRASDFAFTKKVMAEVEATVDAFDGSKYGVTKVELGGRYKKRIEQLSTIEGDLGTTSLVAVLLLVLYIVLHFRRISAVILLLTPLGIGLVVLLGITALFFPTLNILTAFVGAILLGLGIDNGIHLLGRYQHERARGLSSEDAVRITFRGTGRGVALAGITTAVGFSGLAISEFRAFHEFGVIAGLGIVLVVISYLTTLPALLGLLGRFLKREASGGVPFPLTGWVLKKAPVVFGATTLLTIGLAIFGLGVQFDYDFKTLEGGDIPAYALDKVVDELLGHVQSPTIVFVDSREEEEAAVAALRERMEKAEKTGVDFVIASGDVVPADQDAKQEALEELGDILAKVPADALEGDDKTRFDELVQMSKGEPFAFEDLPIDVRRSFSGSGVILVFPNVSNSDGRAVLALSDEVRGIPLPSGKTVSAAGEGMVLADVLRMVLRESPIVVSLTVVLVFLAMWVLLGRLKLAIFCILPALLTVIGTFGLVAATGVKLNYLNIVILPVLFGMAVDAGVHLVTRGVFAGGDIVDALSETGRAVWGASLTTAAGFGALLLAHHPGLNSFGAVALFGLGMIVVASLLWLTSLIGLLQRPKAS